jgi:glutamate carboxypeptidase
MDAREAAAPVLAAAGEILGRPVVAAERGGASDASHFAGTIPVTIDGLGARGGHAHHPDEFVDLDSLLPRAQVALAVTAAALA